MGLYQKRTKKRNEPNVAEEKHAQICSQLTPNH